MSDEEDDKLSLRVDRLAAAMDAARARAQGKEAPKAPERPAAPPPVSDEYAPPVPGASLEEAARIAAENPFGGLGGGIGADPAPAVEPETLAEPDAPEIRSFWPEEAPQSDPSGVLDTPLFEEEVPEDEDGLATDQDPDDTDDIEEEDVSDEEVVAEDDFDEGHDPAEEVEDAFEDETYVDEEPYDDAAQDSGDWDDADHPEADETSDALSSEPDEDVVDDTEEAEAETEDTEYAGYDDAETALHDDPEDLHALPEEEPGALPPLVLRDDQQIAAEDAPIHVPVTPNVNYFDRELSEMEAAATPVAALAAAPDVADFRARISAPRGPALLRLSGVQTDIGRYHILHGVDLEVPTGGVTMLLGRNGAGKTTTLRTIMGLWRAKAGSISLGGREIQAFRPHRISREGIGYVPEDMGVFSDLTVAENMKLAARSGKISQDRLDWIFRAFPALDVFWGSRAGTLSGGQKQMLAVARAMIEKRRLYLIDEPTKGLAPAIVDTLAGALQDLKTQGASILMVEQNFAVAAELGDTAAVMEDGRIVWAGEMAELAEDRDLQARYLGLNVEAL